MAPALVLAAALLATLLTGSLTAIILDLRLKHRHVRARLHERGGFAR